MALVHTTNKPPQRGSRRKPPDKHRADILRQAKAAETLARREMRLFRKVAMTAAVELAAAFERLGAARARVELLRNLRRRQT
jgi:hypothetical protein